MNAEPVTYEHQLAKLLGISKDQIRALRAAHLTGDEWQDVPGRGIALTADAEKKIRAALAAPPPQPAPSATADFVIVRTCPNERVLVCQPQGQPASAPVLIYVCRRQPLPPGRGMILRGCIRNDARDRWEFHGRAARR